MRKQDVANGRMSICLPCWAGRRQKTQPNSGRQSRKALWFLKQVQQLAAVEADFPLWRISALRQKRSFAHRMSCNRSSRNSEHTSTSVWCDIPDGLLGSE